MKHGMHHGTWNVAPTPYTSMPICHMSRAKCVARMYLVSHAHVHPYLCIQRCRWRSPFPSLHHSTLLPYLISEEPIEDTMFEGGTLYMTCTRGTNMTSQNSTHTTCAYIQTSKQPHMIHATAHTCLFVIHLGISHDVIIICDTHET